jgi:hypothetical protein
MGRIDMGDVERKLKNIAVTFLVANVSIGIFIDIVFVIDMGHDSREYFGWIIVTALINAGIVTITSLSLLIGKWRARFLRYAMAMQILNFIPVVLAINVWPGGNDGGGMCWGLFVAPPIFVLGLSAIFLFCLYLIPPRKSKQSTITRLFPS